MAAYRASSLIQCYYLLRTMQPWGSLSGFPDNPVLGKCRTLASFRRSDRNPARLSGQPRHRPHGHGSLRPLKNPSVFCGEQYDEDDWFEQDSAAVIAVRSGERIKEKRVTHCGHPFLFTFTVHGVFFVLRPIGGIVFDIRSDIVQIPFVSDDPLKVVPLPDFADHIQTILFNMSKHILY